MLGGSYNLRHHDAPADEPIELGLDVEDLSWRVRLVPRGASVAQVSHESLKQGEVTIFEREASNNFVYAGAPERPPAGNRIGLEWAVMLHPEDTRVSRVADVIRNLGVFYDPDLRGLREGGARASDDAELHLHGHNVVAVLRKWRDRRDDRPRFDFVDQGLRSAFPALYDGLDFETAGQTVSASVYRSGDATPNPIRDEANGVLAMMVHLAQVASGEEGGLVAIDEPETSLHPYAIRRLVSLTQAWAERRDLTVLLTTHSPVLLDELNGAPDRVFVLERGHPTLPVRLDEMYDRSWLASYTLGDLYVGGEFASNERDSDDGVAGGLDPRPSSEIANPLGPGATHDCTYPTKNVRAEALILRNL
jgi:AAA domain, putative AbiEii toxin, Type IV TA system